MSKENSSSKDLIRHIRDARNALDMALSLLQAHSERPQRSTLSKNNPKMSPVALDFTMPLRAFVKRHCAGMNGAQKFTLVLAYLSKGNTATTVAMSEIEAQWNKMTARSLLGMKFNRFYASQARENDWASTEKTGAYCLRPSWKGIFDA